jgi:hypothetical protein
MSEPQVVQGHRDLAGHPVVADKDVGLPVQNANAAGQPKSPGEGVEQPSPIAQLSSPVYSKVDKKTGKRFYPKGAPLPRVFHSNSEKLTIQLKAVPGFRDLEGNWNYGKHDAVKFRDNVYRTDDPEHIMKIETNRHYGTEIWDADARVIALKKLTDDSILKRVLSDPELAETLKVELGKRDFIESDEKKAKSPKK